MPTRCPRPNPGCALATFVLLYGLLPAQQRLATAGRVLDAAGQPLLAATVTFVGSEPPIGDRFGNADRVVVITDDKGRFRAELLVGSEYSCWAAGPAAAEGSRKVSAVTEGVRAGTGIELRTPHTRRASGLLVSGVEPWQHLGPLRFEIAVAVARLHREPLVLVDGAVPLPTLPIGAAWLLFVLGGNGHLLQATRLEPQAGDVRFGMQPPRAISVRVVDPAGAPIAAATLRVYVANGMWLGPLTNLIGPRPLASWRNVGTTGPDGTAVVHVPGSEDPFACKPEQAPLLLACKLDHFAAISRWQPAEVARRELTFTLKPGASFRGRIVEADGRPLAGAGVQLAAPLSLALGKDTLFVMPTTFSTRTGEDGSFVFDCLPHGLREPKLLVETPPSTELTLAPARTGRVLAPRRPALVRAPALLSPDCGQPFVLDLDTLPMLTLRVADAAGNPARDAHVVLVPASERNFDHTTHAFRLDASGAARVRVQAGTWSLFVTDRVGFAHTVVEVATPMDLALELRELATMRGHVLTNGKPPHDDVLFHLGVTTLGARNADAAAVALQAVGARANQWLVRTTRLLDDGTFVLRFVDVPGTSWNGNIIEPGGKAELKLRAAAELLEFDLRKK